MKAYMEEIPGVKPIYSYYYYSKSDYFTNTVKCCIIIYTISTISGGDWYGCKVVAGSRYMDCSRRVRSAHWHVLFRCEIPCQDKRIYSWTPERTHELYGGGSNTIHDAFRALHSESNLNPLQTPQLKEESR